MSNLPDRAPQVNRDPHESTPEYLGTDAAFISGASRVPAETIPLPEKLAALSYSEGYVYRALWYSRGNRPPYPETTKNDPRRLLMRVNAFRFEDGRRFIAKEQLRELVSSLRDKGYIEFRPNRRRRKPTGKTEGFRRGSFVAVIGPAPRDIEYLVRGHGRGQAHLLPRLAIIERSSDPEIPLSGDSHEEKPALEDAPQKTRVDGHEVTNSPPKQREETESSSGARERATVATKEIEEIEEKLTELAKIVSAHHETPWRPCEEKRSWRVSAIARALECPGNSALLELAVIGTSVRRAKAIARAKDDGQRHRYWEDLEADIVATAASYFYRDRQPWHWEEEINLGFRELVENYGATGDVQDFTGVTLRHEATQ